MKQWFSIVSICMVAVFLFSSVLQFHHHDIDGSVVVYEADTDASDDNHNDICLHHNCNHHSTEHHSDDGCCTLKLSTQQASRPTNLQNVELCFSLLFLGIMSNTISELFAEKHPAHFFTKTIGSLSSLKYYSQGLRAPPSCL